MATKSRSQKLKRLVRGDEDRRGIDGRHIKVGDKEFIYQPYQQNNPLHIDDEVVANIARDYGFALQWCAETVLGQPQDEVMSFRRKNAFAEVVKGNFGGALDHLCDRDGRVTKGGQVLMGRPVEIERYARDYEKKLAKVAITDMQKKHSEEGVDVPGGDHSSALHHNRHRRSYSIPE
jgi:hypothetical protein